MSKRMDDLDSPLSTSTELEEYVKNARDLFRDMYMELGFSAELLQQNLSTIPVATGKNGGIVGAMNSRRRAKRIANNVRRAAESQRYAAGQVAKVWAQFVRDFAPEIQEERNRGHKAKPSFKVDQ